MSTEQVADIEGMAMGTGGLSLITTDEGGIIDDTMITKTKDEQGPTPKLWPAKLAVQKHKLEL